MIRQTLRLAALTLLVFVTCVCWPTRAAAQGANANRSEQGPTGDLPLPRKRFRKNKPPAGRLPRGVTRPVAAPRFVRVSIISNVPYCDVLVEGELAEEGTDEEGRLILPLVSGLDYLIRVSKHGYVFDEQEINVSASEGYEQEVRFTLTRGLLDLEVTTKPPEVDVYLDDDRDSPQRSDATGRVVFKKVDPGIPHTVRGVKARFHEKTAPVTVDPYNPYKLEAELRMVRAVLTLKVKTDQSGADVSLDGEPKGKSDDAGILIIDEVTTDTEHTLRVAKEGFITQDFIVKPNYELAVVNLPPDPFTTGSRELRELVKQGRLAKALDIYTGLAQLAPGNPGLPGLLDELLQAMQARSSGLLARTGLYGLDVRFEEAAGLYELYERARQYRPGEQALQGLAEYWAVKYWLAKRPYIAAAGDKEEALRNARTAARKLGALSPRDAHILLDMGWITGNWGENEAAVRYHSEAQSLNPDWVYPAFGIAVAEMNTIRADDPKATKDLRYERAVNNLNRVIGSEPNLFQPYALRSLAYAVMNRHQEAIADGQRAVDLKPNSAYARYALGFAYFQAGANRDKSAYQNAVKEFNLALTLREDVLDYTTQESIRLKLAEINKN